MIKFRGNIIYKTYIFIYLKIKITYMNAGGVNLKENNKWVSVSVSSEFSDGSMKVVSVGDQRILLIQVQGKIYGIENTCIHMNCPLHRGLLEGYTIKCPCHDWEFDIRTGEHLMADELKLPVFECKIDENDVLIKMEG